MARGRVGWADHVVWWHAYPLGFVGAEQNLEEVAGVAHRLPRLEAWLDHLISLGANGLLLGPGVHLGHPRLRHGRLLPDRPPARVTTPTSTRWSRPAGSAAYGCCSTACSTTPAATSRRSRRRWPRDPARRPRIGCRALYDTGGVITADYFEGHDTLVTLNHRSPRVQAYVREVMLHWLRRGIDGWRLDAAYAVPPTFWAAVLPQVREEFADAWFVGEMIHGDYVAYVETSGLDSVTQYELWKAIWSSHRQHQPPRARLDAAAATPASSSTSCR